MAEELQSVFRGDQSGVVDVPTLRASLLLTRAKDGVIRGS